MGATTHAALAQQRPLGVAGSLSEMASRSKKNAQTNSNARRGFSDGTADLKRRRHERGERIRPGATPNTIPYWSSGFTYRGLEYEYKMVGSDPKKGSATTVVPTYIVPLRFEFPDGQIFDASSDIVDGQTSVQGIVNSPIFNNYGFVLAGTDVGYTQYGDAFQRANFWDVVSTRAGNYHVLLGQPTVLPTQTIVVPPGLGSYFADPSTGAIYPIINEDFLLDQERSIRTGLNVSPRTLPILVWGLVVGESRSFPGQPGAFAWHGAEPANGGVRTFISTSYNPQSRAYGVDVYPLSHEVVEWMDDPFVDNYSAGWNYPYLEPIDRCDSGFTGDLLEVADPVEIFAESSVALPGGGLTYHVTEAMFIDFYTRRDRSRSVNGQYSMFNIGAPFGLPSEPSTLCTGHVEFDPTFVEFPGATFTGVTGINSRGSIVGFYSDASGTHAFVRDHSGFQTLDRPGDLESAAYKINDSGVIVGYFVDSSNHLHGFSYQNGERQPIDFPGAFDTAALGINSRGDIVGSYDNLQPTVHAFILRGGKYQRIDTPYGMQADAYGINDREVITGSGYDDPSGSALGFRLWRGRYSPFAFPGALATSPLSINNANDLAGLFVDPDGSLWGMVTVYGYPYQVYAVVEGNDDRGHIVGYAYDSEDGRYKGFIGQLPLQRNAR
jgi:probable HAF family extracellular repeat protein